jgi:hypothetical protein
MGQLADALNVAARQPSARVQSHWSDMANGPTGVTLPQSWRFETESESAVLRLETHGHVSVAADVRGPPEVIVKWTQAELVDTLLSGRSNERAREQPPTIRFTSDSGRKAFSLLGTSLGL